MGATGVSADAVSSTCLTLGLRPAADNSLARRLPLAVDAGAPVHLTAWDLARHQQQVLAGSQVLVYEKPRVLEAVAQRHGGDVAVVRTSGRPGLVTVDMLHRLAACGVLLAYHGDFDWPGIAVANRLVSEVACRPWLVSAANYLASARDGPALHGAPVTPTRDPPISAQRCRSVAWPSTRRLCWKSVLAALP